MQGTTRLRVYQPVWGVLYGWAVLSLLGLALLGQTPGEVAGWWVTLTTESAGLVRRVPLGERWGRRRWGRPWGASLAVLGPYLAASWPPVLLRSLALWGAWEWSGRWGPSWLRLLPWVLWVWQGLAALAPAGAVARGAREAQWTRAACGPAADERPYPWAGELTPDHANYGATGLAATSPVGIFPKGANPETGVEDMIGNTWEWCRSVWREDGAAGGEADDGLEGEALRVLRGGAFDDGEQAMTCAARSRNHPRARSRCRGFRIVAPAEPETDPGA